MPTADHRPHVVRRLGTALLLLALAALAGCGSGSGAAATHNDADVAFAQGMIPHHAQAVDMAEQAVAKAADPRVRRLAEQVRAAQAPEIATMTGWLESWGADVPATSSDGHEGHGGEDMHGMAGMSGMDGMMSADQMARLESATGARFDRLWLRLMIAHHTGAVAAARAEVADGRSDAAVALARRIAASQAAEIATMRGWLSRS